jgi:hypothetical protein
VVFFWDKWGEIMPKGASGNMQTVRIMAQGRREVEVQGYIINVEGHDFMIHRAAVGRGWNLSDYLSGLGVSNRVGESRAYYERYLAENATTLADIARKAHSVEAAERRPRIINR